MEKESWRLNDALEIKAWLADAMANTDYLNASAEDDTMEEQC